MNAVVVIALLGLAAPVAAQGGPSIEVDLALAPESVEAADRLQAEAYTLFGDREQWGRAARLLERSAQLRPDHDPARARGYLIAARVYAHSDALTASQRAFEKSAAASEQVGAVVDAARAYADAADMALRRGDEQAANGLTRRAILLSRSPHLDDSERLAITKRLPQGVPTG